jgi:glycosyltransferase involved in cell wall biosynthesis
MVGKQVLKSADRIIAVSNATKRYVHSIGADPARTNVIHNGVDTNRFKPDNEKRDAIRKKLEIPDDATVALTVRRLVYKNGIGTLMESAKTAIKNAPRLIFLIVGTGPDAEKIRTDTEQSGMQRNFRLTGFVSDQDLPAHYNAADFFVLPSNSGEGLPLVALEAMACGLPVIATRVGGTPEIMPQGFGKLVPPDEPSSMAEAILEYSRKQLSTLRKGVRTMVEKEFSWEKNVERLAEKYEELI